ncbi:uncharacterized protein JCM15063_001857 [Sporobolomyces koalae]|uniref:uncharacterized protein n=1 Tax=Sporobolomyces koalae TaxID=500713 RepID=UPI00318023D2
MNSIWDASAGYLRTWFASPTTDSGIGTTRHRPDEWSDTKPFPTLPRELVLRILAHTLPPEDRAGRDRTRLLCGYCQLDRDCARWASHQLRRCIDLRTPRSAHKFAETVRGHLDREHWRTSVKHVSLGQPDAEHRSMLEDDWTYAQVDLLLDDILTNCPNLEELRIAGLKDLRLSSLSRGTNLRKLYLFETRVESSSSAPALLCLPQLRSLHLKAVICTGSTLHELLSPATVPKLDTLAFLSVHQSLVGAAVGMVRHPEQPRDQNQANLRILNTMFAHLVPTPHDSSSLGRPAYSDLAPQIKHLTLGPYSTRTLPLASLPLFTSLASLSIPMRLFGSDAMDIHALACSLSALRLTSSVTRSDHREEQFDASLHRLRWTDAIQKALSMFESRTSNMIRVVRVASDSKNRISAQIPSVDPVADMDIDIVELAFETEPPTPNSIACLVLDRNTSRVSFEWVNVQNDPEEAWDLGFENWRDRL